MSEEDESKLRVVAVQLIMQMPRDLVTAPSADDLIANATKLYAFLRGEPKNEPVS